MAEVGSASNGRLTLGHHEAPKLLIGLICLPVVAPLVRSLTSVQIEVRYQNAARLRVMIEAAPRLPLEPTELVVKLPKGQELGMVSWLARDPKTGVTWLIQGGDKAESSHSG